MRGNPDTGHTAFVEVRIDGEERLLEELAGILSQLGFEGFWEDGSSLRCYIRGSRWDPRLRGEVEEVVRMVSRHADTPLPRVSVSSVEEENWNERWERTIRPIRITGRIVIAPSWHPHTPRGDEIVITIDPKMSFGTGYHESTRLAARLLESVIHPGDTLLDVGTGTGILAIAAARLGSRRAVGVDTDDWAYRNAVENVAANGLEDRVTVFQGGPEVAPPGPYDVIVANIQRSVILELLPQLLPLLAPEGVLIFSGLLESDGEILPDTLQAAGLESFITLHENEWFARAVRRRKGKGE